jgi:HEAT repeat protein
MAGALAAGPPASAADVPPVAVITADAAKFLRQLASRAEERRIDGLQGLAFLKYWPAEEAVLPLLDDPSLGVRRAAVAALARLGGVRSVPRLIALPDPSPWDLRQEALAALRQLTAQDFPDQAAWENWWADAGAEEKERALWSLADQPPVAAPAPAVIPAVVASTPGRRGRKPTDDAPPAHPRRRQALRALVGFASPASEDALIRRLQEPQSPPLDAVERSLVTEALERLGSTRAIATLAGERSEAAAWALGSLGGPEAEHALLAFPPSLPVLLALDRLGSTRTGPLLPDLVAHMGQITYRSQPDDVMNDDLQPVQRAGANLIRRSGLAPAFIEAVLQELEDTMQPPVPHAPKPETPAEWNGLFQRMRSELRPGFVREDGVTTSQPVVALCYLADDPALAPRLIPLLRHPALVVRVYVALSLGRLRAHQAVPALAAVIREGYDFSDSVALASGKHFDRSQTVRWRGFLCMALGRLGGPEARILLESLAADPAQPRDIRYSAVVGLRFIADPASLPVLRRVAGADIIRLVRDEAVHAAGLIEINARDTEP